MRYLKYFLVIAASLALAACGAGGSGETATATGTGVISLNGGAGGSGAGGNGGMVTTLDAGNPAVHGDLKFSKTGTVNASFAVPAINPNFGGNHATIYGVTIVATAPVNNTYYVSNVDNTLHFVDNAGTDTGIVTGLTVNAGAFLHLPNVPVVISEAVIVNGTVTTLADGDTLDLRAGSLLRITPNGMVTTTPAAGVSGQINLVSGGVLINQGSVESNGVAGASGGVTLQATTFLYNTGNVKAMGDGVGNGGAIQLLSDTASVFSSGTVDASGGSGATGGNGGSITISGGTSASAIGRALVRGSLISNSGNGSSGNGGNGGAIILTSFSGGIVVNAVISANGGDGAAVGNGGNGGSLQLNNRVGSDTAAQHETSPQGIKVAGNIRLNGGAGVVNAGNGRAGGDGGAISILSDVAGSALPGFANVEFSGYQAINLNGGESTGDNGGNGGNVSAVLDSSLIVDVEIPAGAVRNAVAINAKGGDGATTGGSGGTLTFSAPQPGGSTDPARSLVINSGAINVSGGAGDTGGLLGRVTLSSYGKVTNSGTITARGGEGTTQGGGIPAVGDPRLITVFVSLSSTSNVANSGAIIVSGGGGANGGNAGGVSLTSGNKTTNSAAITARGGNGSTGNGGNGGIIFLSSEWAPTGNTGALSVAKGNGVPGGSQGIILINGVNVTPVTPN